MIKVILAKCLCKYQYKDGSTFNVSPWMNFTLKNICSVFWWLVSKAYKSSSYFHCSLYREMVVDQSLIIELVGLIVKCLGWAVWLSNGSARYCAGSTPGSSRLWSEAAKLPRAFARWLCLRALYACPFSLPVWLRQRQQEVSIFALRFIRFSLLCL